MACTLQDAPHAKERIGSGQAAAADHVAAVDRAALADESLTSVDTTLWSTNTEVTDLTNESGTDTVTESFEPAQLWLETLLESQEILQRAAQALALLSADPEQVEAVESELGGQEELLQGAFAEVEEHVGAYAEVGEGHDETAALVGRSQGARARVWSVPSLPVVPAMPGAAVSDCPPGTTAVLGTDSANLFTVLLSKRCIVAKGGSDSISLLPTATQATVLAGAGADQVVLSPGASQAVVVGHGEADSILANADAVVAFGGDGSDNLFGSLAGDTLIGGSGQDALTGGAGNDVLFGQADGDTLSGGAGSDVLVGGAGSDFLTGDAGLLPAGDDIIYPGDGADFVDAGPGNDTVVLLNPCELRSPKMLVGGTGTDTLVLPVAWNAATLLARGFAVSGFESIVVDTSQLAASDCASCACADAPSLNQIICCSGHGTCDPLTSVCACEAGTSPPSCEETTPGETCTALGAKLFNDACTLHESQTPTTLTAVSVSTPSKPQLVANTTTHITLLAGSESAILFRPTAVDGGKWVFVQGHDHVLTLRDAATGTVLPWELQSSDTTCAAWPRQKVAKLTAGRDVEVRLAAGSSLQLLVLAQADHKSTYFPDGDADTYGRASDTPLLSACATPSGHASRAGDCQDSNPAVHPDATELCDSVDNNCNSQTDEGVKSTFYADADGDGSGDASTSIQACTAPSGFVSTSDDCNDARADVRPGAAEACDSVDNDCDGVIDEGVLTTYYRDADLDTFGNAAVSTQACTQPAGHVAAATDCDDTRADVHPGRAETCDGLDNNCDSAIDEGVLLTFYRDADGDGAGDAAHPLTVCTAPAGYVTNANDCNDASAAQSPSAVESCDGVDNDCDGNMDEPGSLGEVTTFADGDGDGFGLADSAVTSCAAAPGRATNDDDCDDANAAIFPSAAEVCDGLDNDCDAAADEAGASGEQNFFVDGDADGFGNGSGPSIAACTAPSGYVQSSSDCDDVNAGVHPDAAETCDGFDNDCDHGIDESCSEYIPPDPSLVAPELNPVTETHFFEQVSFLYAGEPPIQTGVVPGSIDPHRIGVIYGTLTDTDNEPIAGVEVRIADHPEWGSTRTRADGGYDLAVNGGGTMVVQYVSASHLPVLRHVEVPWQDFARVDDVALTALDSAVASISLTQPVEVAVSSTSTDADGSRRSVLMFKSGTHASMRMPDGSSVPLSSFHVRSTEYTVGERGPAAMPMELPNNTGYTYAVEYSVDEAQAAGATQVEFDKPVIAYVENFLDFPVGEQVPTGFVDSKRHAWLPGPYGGLVLKVTGVAAGKALLDLNGDGVAEPTSAYASLLIDDAEREAVAGLYTVGQELWRVPLLHFSPWDYNWGFAPPPSGNPPDLSPDGGQPDDEPLSCGGSIIDVSNQGLGERLSVSGTPFSLYYTTRRVPGRRADYQVELETYSPPPFDTLRVETEMHIAGRRTFVQESGPSGFESFKVKLEWDGMDRYGRVVSGLRTPSKLCMTYIFLPQVVSISAPASSSTLNASRFGYNGNGLVIEGGRNSREFAFPTCVGKNAMGGPVALRAAGAYLRAADWKLGIFDAKRSVGLGGWTLDIHHNYAPVTATLFLGTGESQDVRNTPAIVNTLATFADLVGDVTYGIDTGPDGSVYVAAGRLVFRVWPNGTVERIAGTGNAVHGGDGGLAINASFVSAIDLAVAADGTIYIADRSAHRVRKIDVHGNISTFAGTGAGSINNNEGVATATPLATPRALDIGADGTVYILHGGTANQNMIKRVGADGLIRNVMGIFPCLERFGAVVVARDKCYSNLEDIALGPEGALYFTEAGVTPRLARLEASGNVTTIAGGGALPIGTEDELGTAVKLGFPQSLEIAKDGTIFYAESSFNQVKIFAIDRQGYIHRVAGTGPSSRSGDGGSALRASFASIFRIALHPDTSLIVSERDVKPIRRISLGVAGYRVNEATGLHQIPNRDGREVYIFDQEGRHLETRDAITGVLHYAFAYTSDSKLSAVADAFNNVTQIERDASGDPTAIVSPNGVRTALSIGTDGYLSSVTNPTGATTSLSYGLDGLLTRLENPRGYAATFSYDDDGRLLQDKDTGGGFKNLLRTKQVDGWLVEMSTKMGRKVAASIGLAGAQDTVRQQISPAGIASRSKRKGVEIEDIIYPNGSQRHTERTGDSRFGFQAPVNAQMTTTTPGGLTTNTVEQRTVALNDPQDLLSVRSWSRSISRNDESWLDNYDASTRTWTTTSPEGRITMQAFGAQGEVVRIQQGALAPVFLNYDLHGRLATASQSSGPITRSSTQTYDSSGNLASIEDTIGRVTRFEYDEKGRITKQVFPDLRAVQFDYDEQDNLAVLIPPSRPSHEFDYNALDQALSYEPPAVAGVTLPQTTFAYNDDHQLIKVTRPDGQTVEINYDLNTGRVQSMVLPDRQLVVSYEPTTGALASIEDTVGNQLHYVFDGPLLISETAAGTVNATVSRTYDARHRVRSERINGGHAIDFAYDMDGQVSQVGDLTLHREENGLVQTAQLSGIGNAWIYDAFGSIAEQSVLVVGGVLHKLGYTRDASGRVKSKREAFGDINVTRCYEYDLAGRLYRVYAQVTESSCTGDILEEYRYDDNSNRIYAKNNAGVVDESQIEIDDQDRVVRYGEWQLSYSDNGELNRKENLNTSEVFEFFYDVFGNLAQVILPSGDTIDYVADPRNRRINKSINGAPVQGFVYGNQLEPIAQLDGSGQIVARFAYQDNRHWPEYMVKDGITYRYVVDHLGSVLAVINVISQETVQRLEYDAWGRVLMDTNLGFQPFGFAGGIWDTDVELVRFGARDYDPELGRWTAKDPLRFKAKSTNLFDYTWGDPVNFVDPDGRNPWLLAAGGMALWGLWELYDLANDFDEGAKLGDDLGDKRRAELDHWRNPKDPADPNLHDDRREAEKKFMKKMSDMAADQLGPPNAEDLFELSNAARLACPK